MKNILIVLIVMSIVGCNLAPENTKNAIVGKWVLVEPISMATGMKMTRLDTEFTQNGNVIITTGIEALGQYNEGTSSGAYKIDGDRILYSTGAVFEIKGNILESKVPTSNGEVTIRLKKQS